MTRPELTLKKIFEKIIGEDRSFKGLHDEGVNTRCICQDCNFAHGYNTAKRQIRQDLDEFFK